MKRVIEFDVSASYGLRDCKGGSFMDVENKIYEWRFESGYEPTEGLDIDDIRHDIEEAYSYISKKTGLTRADLNKWQDNIESDFRAALNDAYWASYAAEWFDRWWAALANVIWEALPDFRVYVKDYKGKLVELSESPKEIDLDSNTVYIKPTREQMIAYLGEEYKGQSWEELADSLYQEVIWSMGEVDTEHIDYYGTLGDSDDWMEYFQDYNETEEQIVSGIKKHTAKVRAYVKNSVPLEYRVASC